MDPKMGVQQLSQLVTRGVARNLFWGGIKL